jgi:hypothetical protein
MLGGRHRKAATTKNKKAKTKTLRGIVSLVRFGFGLQ